MDLYYKRVKTIINSLGQLRYSQVSRVDELWRAQCGYRLDSVFKKEEHEWHPFAYDESWGGADQHHWFYTTVRLPESYSEENILLFLNTGAVDIWNTDNPQIVAYVNGKMAATLDMNHTSLPLCNSAKAGVEYELAFYAYSNSKENTNRFHLSMAVCRKNVEKLYYDMKVLWEAADCLRDEDEERGRILELLNSCVNCLDLRRTDSQEFLTSVDSAINYLQEHYYQAEHSTSPVTVHSIGHTHIDVAWKWPLRQTREKTVRSFLTVLNLMEQYPEYRFMSSQPQLYQFVKEQAPALYEKIKQRVAEGRWETEGAMWLEADCNLTSGESLIRQILYGKKFFNQEFGTGDDNRVLWLPDVFGYSVALPQILRKSGIRYFMTTKIGWNEVNQIPNDTMMWQGLDGSKVLTYFITTSDYCAYPELKKKRSFGTTYNGMQNVSQIMGTWQRYQNKQLSQDVLTCYGHGDGGGGTTPAMLEENQRITKGVGRCPKTELTAVKSFFEKLEENLEGKQVPVWNGELYLETHRGTYTSMARNKKNNRECEFLCADAELFQTMAMTCSADSTESLYPTEALEYAWKLVLLNQFHDILPGSSIKDVYEDSDIQYSEVRKITKDLIWDGQKRILEYLSEQENGKCQEQALAVFNQLGFERTSLLHCPAEVQNGLMSGKAWNLAEERQLPSAFQKTWDGQLLYLADHLASKGVRLYPVEVKTDRAAFVVSSFEKDNGNITELHTGYYDIIINKAGEIHSLYDRRERRELIADGEMGNRLLVFEDRPAEYDAWNIDAFYEEKSWIVDDVREVSLIENGEYRACLFIRKQFLDSEIRQYIYFYRHTGRIDFETEVEWKEQQLLLKVAFPVDIHADKAVYEVQFGNVERPTHRNTSWEQAKFEVCGHKWADLSEYGYGVALLNNCKYGYDIHDSVMRLTLIKSGIFPNPDADKELHRFTYALYPHRGDFREGKVIQEAYDLNCPLYGALTTGTPGFACSYLSVDAQNVFVDTVKAAEDGNGVIVRLYEAYGKRTRTKLHMLQAAHKKAFICDCMEKPEAEIANEDGVMELMLKPYEIVTVRMQ